MFDPNNFTLSSVFSFQTAWLIKRKAVHLKVFFFLDRMGSQLVYFFKLHNI